MTTKDICKEIHKRVSKGFHPISDKEQFKVEEFWYSPEDPDKVVGDCDEFAIVCRRLLRQSGLESRLVICTTPDRETHLVCAVDTFILDNLQTSVKTIRQLTNQGYKFKYLSGYNPGDAWHVIK